MVQESHGAHHYNTRKRIHQKHEPYPHPNKFKRFLDNLIFIIGVLGPLVALPQILNIWVNHAVVGVSIFSWSAFFVLALVWTLYGLLHKELPIIIANVLWMILDFLIVLGVIIYR